METYIQASAKGRFSWAGRHPPRTIRWGITGPSSWFLADRADPAGPRIERNH